MNQRTFDCYYDASSNQFNKRNRTYYVNKAKIAALNQKIEEVAKRHIIYQTRNWGGALGAIAPPRIIICPFLSKNVTKYG